VGQTLQQRIDLIEHLLEFGRQLIVLTGPPGSGKSTLLQAIAIAAGQRWTCVPVQGGPALSGRGLLIQVADALDVDLSADSEPRMAQTMVRLRLNVLERSGKLVVVLVDDADKLPSDAVTAVLALARTDDQTGEARVLMTADHDHAGLLANLQRDRPQHGLVHVVEIPPLSEGQVADFLSQRLAALGLELGACFNAADIQSIAAAADGNPARIVALARQHFAGKRAARAGGQRRPAAPRPRLAGAGFKLPRLADKRLLPLLLVPPLAAALAWWALRDRPADKSDTTAAVALELPAAAELPRAAPEPAPEKPVADARFADHGDSELIEIVLPDEPVPPANAQPEVPSPSPMAVLTPDPVTAPPIPKAVLPPPPAAAPTAPRSKTVGPTPALKSAPASGVAPAPPPKPVPPPQPAPKPASPSAPKSVVPAPVAPGSTGFSADWLLKQPRGAYTLQLAGVSNRATAASFIQRHGLSAAATVLTTRREGQAWYVLVHGYYPTRQAALAAAQRLSPAVRKEVKPWVRTVGELASLPR